MHEILEIAIIELAKIIEKNYKKRPILTLSVIVGVISIIASLAIGINHLNKQEEKNIILNSNIDERLKKLSEVQNSLKDLSIFIETQKKSIVTEKNTLENLKEEKNQLEPIVKANRELVEKIFAQQEKNSKWQFWLSIVLGFVLGIIGTFIATIIEKSYRKYKLKKPAPNS
jgi:uncharacterized membrane protein